MFEAELDVWFSRQKEVLATILEEAKEHMRQSAILGPNELRKDLPSRVNPKFWFIREPAPDCESCGKERVYEYDSQDRTIELRHTEREDFLNCPEPPRNAILGIRYDFKVAQHEEPPEQNETVEAPLQSVNANEPVQFYTCIGCGSLVSDRGREDHDEFHRWVNARVQ